MKPYLFPRRSLGVGAALAALVTAAPAAPAMADSAHSSNAPCSAPDLTQPYLAAGDANWYTLAPGQSADNFDANGWTLSGGARLVTTTLADGTTGQVLDLPTGAQAVSPRFCVRSDFQFARATVQDVAGSDGINFSVAYNGGHSDPGQTGVLNGGQGAWGLSDPVALQPDSRNGQQHVTLTLTGAGTNSDTQVYGLWIDPRMGR
jgi:hypothetical protein